MREANVSVRPTDFEAMGLGELIALGHEAGIVDLEELVCHGTGAVVQVTVETRYDEDRIDELEAVDHWEHVADTDSGHVYVIAFTAPDLPEHLAASADDLVGTCDPALDESGATVSFVGDQSTIAETIDGFQDAGASPDLRRLGDYTGRTRDLDVLTSRQREVLETAFELGYYEVPREATTDAVAAELDLDPSTVVEHLQRAERNVFSELL